MPGCAATVVVLGCIFLGFLAGWILSAAGWKEQGGAATMAGLCYIYIHSFGGPGCWTHRWLHGLNQTFVVVRAVAN